MANRYATQAEVEALFPQFKKTSDQLVTIVMSMAEACIGLRFYGEKASEAHMLMSAHMLWLHPSAGPTGKGWLGGSYSSGDVASMSDGPSSISWHAPSSEFDAWLGKSPAGQMLEALNATLAHKSAGALARRSPGALPFGNGCH